MSGSINKAIIIGNLGKDPEIKTMQSGDKVANFSVATSEKWKDKNGEKQERTQWHNIVILNQNIVKVAEQYLKKGAKVYIEGAIETRSYEKDGITRYTTEIVIRPYRGELTMLDGKRTEDYDRTTGEIKESAGVVAEEDEDEIPF